MTQHPDVYEKITAAIIEAIEAGCTGAFGICKGDQYDSLAWFARHPGAIQKLCFTVP